jgi:predicted permease
MAQLIRDVRHAALRLRRDRGFTLSALLALTLGIGTTTAVFSVLYGVLLRPLPFPEPDRLVRVYEEHPGAPKPPGDREISSTTLKAWQPRLRTLDDLAPYFPLEFTVTFGEGPVRLHGAQAAPSLFGLLRAVPQAGRFFLPGEDAPRANLFVVIADRLWRERFGGSPEAIGRTLTIEGKPHVIVGVARPGLVFPDADVQLWVPYDDPTRLDPTIQGGVWLAMALGRLKPGTAPAQAAAEGTAAARSVPRPRVLDALFGSGGAVEVRVEPVVAQMTAEVRPILLVVGASVACLLLLACANVANLLLARGVTRQRELALRTALGARRGRLVRQLLAEVSLLAAAGAAAGTGVAWGLVRVFAATAPDNLPRAREVHVDASAWLFALGAAVACTLLCGLVPALRGTSFDLSASLHGGDGAVAGGFRGLRARRWRDGLLACEAAVATVLLIGAALFGRSAVALAAIDPGYDVSGVLAAQVFLPPDAADDRAARLAGGLVDRLRASPGVIAAGAGNMMPFSESTFITAFDLPPAVAGGRPARVRAWAYQVTPGYAEALGLRLRAGRLFETSDTRPDRFPVLVNDEFVRRYLRQDPIGRTFTGGAYGRQAVNEIVGVVGDMLKDGNDQRPVPEIYGVARAGNAVTYELDVIVRTAGDPRPAAAALRAAVAAIEPAAAVGSAAPLSVRVNRSFARPRFSTAVLSGFAGAALVLASVGLFGVLSYTVSQRQRELSLRAALGADRARLMALVARDGLVVVAAGLVAGTGAAALLARAIRGVLFGIAPLDPMSFALAPLVLLPVAAAACLLPARRAARSDPAVLLRE